jgi:hypothetical protein
MTLRKRVLGRLAFGFAAIALAATASPALADSLKKGTVELKSAGALAIGPDGVLFVADPKSATIYALATDDTKPSGMGDLNVAKIDVAIAGQLGIKPEDLKINDLKVNPKTGTIYISGARGRTPTAEPVIVKISGDGKPTILPLKEIPGTGISIDNAVTNEKQRVNSITSMSFVKGTLIISGLSNEEWASNLRSIPFPFVEATKGTSVQIYHGAHGKLETQAPIQTFTAYDIGGQTNILASYVCTPLVRFPVDQLKPGEKVVGKTLAELGNRNRPLDIITYTKDGKDFALIANSARGIMKVSLDGIDKAEAITERINGTAGLKFQTIEAWKGVEQLDKVNADKAIVLKKDGSNYTLEIVPLP